MRQQTICRVEGCDKLTASKGNRNGAPDYRTVCEKHRRPKHDGVVQKLGKAYIPNDTCEHCGWQGQCHRHRLDGSLTEYIPTNIWILCPNCHQEVHRGIIKAPSRK